LRASPGNDVRRQVVLTWANAVSKPERFGSIWVDVGGHELAVMYRFHGFGYDTDIQVAARALK
jgi:hypothetical protein